MKMSDRISELPEGYTYHIRISNAKEFTFSVKEIINENVANEWLKAYEEKTKVTWRILRTCRARGKINLYRKDYRCQHNTDQRHRQRGVKISQHTGCKATLKLMIRCPKHYQKQDMMYPCLCIQQSVHNHCLDSAAVLRFRDMSAHTKDKLIQYFQQGMGGTAARRALQAELLFENEENYDDVIADASVLPSLSKIHKLLNKEMQKSPMERPKHNIHQILEQKLETYQVNTDGKALMKQFKKKVVVAICSPIMQRFVTRVPEVRELILVDSSVNMDISNLRMYFFICPCIAGGIPIGCIITDLEGEYGLREGVLLLKKCFNDEAFSKEGPSTFVSDGNSKERKVLQEVYNTPSFLSCQFHTLRSVWTWVCETRHNISKENRHETYFLIKDLVCADSENSFNEQFKCLTKSPIYKNNDKLQNYVKLLLLRKHVWASYCSQDVSHRVGNAEDYIESSFRVVNNNILHKVKGFNVLQLVDFIISRHETHLKNKLLNFSFSRYVTSKFKKKTSALNDSDFDIINFDTVQGPFIINFQTGQTYALNIERWFCSCKKGLTGALCSHVSTCFLDNDIDSDNIVKLIYEVATGNDAENEKRLQPLTFDPNNHDEVSSAVNSICLENCIELRAEVSVESSCERKRQSEIFDVTENLEKLFERIRNGLIQNPKTYLPTVESLLKNYEQFASSESGFISALSNFANPESSSKTPTEKNTNKIQTSVQPMFMGRPILPKSSKIKEIPTPLQLTNIGGSIFLVPNGKDVQTFVQPVTTGAPMILVRNEEMKTSVVPTATTMGEPTMLVPDKGKEMPTTIGTPMILVQNKGKEQIQTSVQKSASMSGLIQLVGNDGKEIQPTAMRGPTIQGKNEQTSIQSTPVVGPICLLQNKIQVQTSCQPTTMGTQMVQLQNEEKAQFNQQPSVQPTALGEPMVLVQNEKSDVQTSIQPTTGSILLVQNNNNKTGVQTSVPSNSTYSSLLLVENKGKEIQNTIQPTTIGGQILLVKNEGKQASDSVQSIMLRRQMVLVQNDQKEVQTFTQPTSARRTILLLRNKEKVQTSVQPTATGVPILLMQDQANKVQTSDQPSVTEQSKLLSQKELPASLPQTTVSACVQQHSKRKQTDNKSPVLVKILKISKSTNITENK